MRNGKIVLRHCASDDECSSVATARVPMPGGIIVKKEAWAERSSRSRTARPRRSASCSPLVKRWLKTHRRTTLIVGLKSSDSEYDNDWSTTLRLPLRA